MIEFFPNVISVYLPSSLKWGEIEAYAHSLVQKEMGLVWDFSFPITSSQPDQMVMKAWEFTIEHFKKTLFPIFEKETKGFILYKGPCDFGNSKHWMPEDKENFSFFLEGRIATDLRRKLFCRDQGFLRLKELAPLFPDTLPLYLLFDSADLILAEYSYDYFSMMIKGQLQTLKEHGKEKNGFVLPLMMDLEESDIMTIEEHLRNHPHCRLIPEALLTQEWHGLDTLFVLPNRLTFQGQRKVNGFIAAGGSISEI